MGELRMVGVGASAGGVEALFDLVRGLEHGFTAVVLVVLHQASGGPQVLADLLDARCALAVTTARDGDLLEPGRVLVAPPDAHLHVRDGHAELHRGPKENGHRPGIDPLFRSLALAAGSGATGVVLSGLLDDGAAGLLDIVRHGGAAVVQDPTDALHDGMPTAALRQVPGALVRPAGGIGPLLAEVAARHPLGDNRPSAQLTYEVEISRGQEHEMTQRDPPGAAAGLSCPDCSGPLFDVSTGRDPRYRCRVGHAWSPESLAAEQDDVVERALYVALRALEDKVALAHRVATTARAARAAGVASTSRRSAQEALRSATVLRRLLVAPAEPDEGVDNDQAEGGDGTNNGSMR